MEKISVDIEHIVAILYEDRWKELRRDFESYLCNFWFGMLLKRMYALSLKGFIYFKSQNPKKFSTDQFLYSKNKTIYQFIVTIICYSKNMTENNDIPHMTKSKPNLLKSLCLKTITVIGIHPWFKITK